MTIKGIFRAKYGNIGGKGNYLLKKMKNKDRQFFDSGDYNMNAAKQNQLKKSPLGDITDTKKIPPTSTKKSGHFIGIKYYIKITKFNYLIIISAPSGKFPTPLTDFTNPAPIQNSPEQFRKIVRRSSKVNLKNISVMNHY